MNVINIAGFSLSHGIRLVLWLSCEYQKPSKIHCFRINFHQMAIKPLLLRSNLYESSSAIRDGKACFLSSILSDLLPKQIDYWFHVGGVVTLLFSQQTKSTTTINGEGGLPNMLKISRNIFILKNNSNSNSNNDIKTKKKPVTVCVQHINSEKPSHTCCSQWHYYYSELVVLMLLFSLHFVCHFYFLKELCVCWAVL